MPDHFLIVLLFQMEAARLAGVPCCGFRWLFLRNWRCVWGRMVLDGLPVFAIHERTKCALWLQRLAFGGVREIGVGTQLVPGIIKRRSGWTTEGRNLHAIASRRMARGGANVQWLWRRRPDPVVVRFGEILGKRAAEAQLLQVCIDSCFLFDELDPRSSLGGARCLKVPVAGRGVEAEQVLAPPFGVFKKSHCCQVG